MKFALLLALAAALPYFVNAAEDGDFHTQWATVCTMALSDTEAATEAQELLQADPKGASFVAQFWAHKAMASCQGYRRELNDLYASRFNLAKTDAEKSKLQADLRSDVSFALMGYYYDHSFKIKTMIAARLSASKDAVTPAAPTALVSSAPQEPKAPAEPRAASEANAPSEPSVPGQAGTPSEPKPAAPTVRRSSSRSPASSGRAPGGGTYLPQPLDAPDKPNKFLDKLRGK